MQEAAVEAGAHNVSLSSSDTDPRSRLSPAGPGKLTVRAMPDPDSSFNTDRLESLQSAEHIRSVLFLIKKYHPLVVIDKGHLLS